MITKGLEINIIILIQLEQIPRVRTKSIVRLEEEDLEDYAEHKRAKIFLNFMWANIHIKMHLMNAKGIRSTGTD